MSLLILFYGCCFVVADFLFTKTISASDNSSIQLFIFSLTQCLRNIFSIQFVCLVWPFICGWYVMEYFSFILKYSINIFQQAEVNNLSQSLIIFFRSSRTRTIRSLHRYPRFLALQDSLNGRQCAHLEYLSTTTHMLSY